MSPLLVPPACIVVVGLTLVFRTLQNEYTATQPTATSDRLCLGITLCNSSQYRVAPATSTSNTVCAAISDCPVGVSYQIAAPTATSDRRCETCSGCPLNHVELTPCTPLTDSTCRGCTVCGDNKFASTPCTIDVDTDCADCRTCTPGTFQSAACHPNADTECTPCTSCPAGTYASAACTATQDTTCTNVTTCLDDEFISTPATPTSNAVCQEADSCISECQGRDCACPFGCHTCMVGEGLSVCTLCKNSNYLYRGLCFSTCDIAPGTTPVGTGSFSRFCRSGPNDIVFNTPPQEFEAMPLTATSDRVCQVRHGNMVQLHDQVSQGAAPSFFRIRFLMVCCVYTIVGSPSVLPLWLCAVCSANSNV
jgi:hypothetical protein